MLAAAEIAAAPGVAHLAMGGVDLARDLSASSGNLATLYVRSHLVLASRAAAIARPSTASTPTSPTTRGCASRPSLPGRWGFRQVRDPPRQLPILHEVFTPTTEEITWAREVIAAFDAAGGAALRLPSGEFMDLPVADRARRLLHLAASARG